MPLRSMTAYGEAKLSSPDGELSCTLQSTNRRHREIDLALPSGLSAFEPRIREMLQEKIHRGAIQCTFLWKPTQGVMALTPNLALARELKKGWEAIAETLNIPANFSLELLKGEKGLFTQEEREGIGLQLMEKTLLLALDKHIEGREREGEWLLRDFILRIGYIESYLAKIETHLPLVVTHYREKLQKKIADIFKESPVVEERVLKELALFAEKADITEEIVRLKILLHNYRATLHDETTFVKGKKLEFQLQEMLREINTIGSKSQDMHLAELVIECKSELEKMREQIQNIE